MFETRLDQHLERRKHQDASKEIARRRQLMTVEIFRQADFQSNVAHQLRSAERSFLSLVREVVQITHEIQILTAVIIWVWDNAKDKKEFIDGIELIDTHLRLKAEISGDLHDLMDIFNLAKTNPEAFFKETLENLISLSKDDELFLHNPVQILRQIHHVQDRIFISKEFLDLLCKVAETEKLLDNEKLRSIKTALHHISHLEQTLIQKEKLFTD